MKQVLQAATILLLMLTGVASAGSEAHYRVLPGERARLNELSHYLDRPLRAGDMAELSELLDDPDQAVAVLAASLLFKNGPADHWDAILRWLAVRDYDLRDQGLYDRVLQEDVPPVIDALESGQPEMVDDRLTMLLVFLHYRDSNQWIVKGDQPISLARLFRTAFLTSVLAGTEIDPLETANAIDRATRADMGF